MSQLTLDNFDNNVSSTIYRRGKKYYNAGNVIYANEITPEHYDALVMGSGTNYQVNILFDGAEIIQTDCSCPYDWGDMCKHVVATLLELRQTIVKTVPSKKTIQKQVTSAEKSEIVKATIVPVEKQMEVYTTLSLTEQRLIKIPALGWQAFSQTKLAEIFNNCEFKHDGKRLYPNVFKPILKKLVKMGYLTLNRDNQYACHRGFAENLCQQFYTTDTDFSTIAKHFQRYSGSYYYYSHSEYGSNLFRDMRIARYADEPKQFEDNYYALASQTQSKHTQKTLCDYWLPSLFDIEKIDGLPLGVRAFLLKEKLTLQLFNLTAPDEYFLYTVENLSIFEESNKDKIALLLGMLFLLRGEWKNLETITPTLSANPIKLGIITAIRQFIVGKTEAALDTFEVTLKLLKKNTRDNKLHFYNLEGIFHLLTKLKIQKESLYKKADSHITWALKNPSSYNTVFHWLKGVRLFLKKKKKEGLNLIRFNKNNDPIIAFFRPFCLFWIDDRKVEKNDLKKLYEKTSKNGYQWMANELLILSHVIDPSNPGREALLKKKKKQLG
ncbi:MAG: SWIM zinc finger domain-containing protein, partial [Saprospiraceae bacterium]